MINTKTRTILKVVGIVLAFAILLGGGHLLANNFLVSQENNTPKAEVVTETYDKITISYDNSYGIVSSCYTSINYETDAVMINFTFDLNKSYIWNSSSVIINTKVSISALGFEENRDLTYTRTDNFWEASTNMMFLSNCCFTFPVEDLVQESFVSQTYNINYNLNGGTNGENTPTTYNSSLSSQTLTIPNPTRTEYTFSSWTVSGASASISGTTLTIHAKATGDITLTANWTINKYNITVIINNDQLGTVSSTGGTYDYGTTLILTATANENATFIEWLDTETWEVYTDNPLTITVTKDITLQAIFSANTLSVLPTIGGEVRVSGFDLADNNSIVHLSALAYKGYRFAGWTVNDGTDLSAYGDTADIPYILVKGKIVTANFEIVNNLDVNGETDNNENGNII